MYRWTVCLASTRSSTQLASENSCLSILKKNVWKSDSFKHGVFPRCHRLQSGKFPIFPLQISLLRNPIRVSSKLHTSVSECQWNKITRENIKPRHDYQWGSNVASKWECTEESLKWWNTLCYKTLVSYSAIIFHRWGNLGC